MKKITLPIKKETSPQTIMIIDDNLANLEIAQKILNDNNFDVIIAVSAEEADEIMQYETPDLILLDIMMPGVNGFEYCKKLKNDPKKQDIPIIFLTALTQPEDLVRGFAMGGADYITKPFSKDVLLTRVKNQLELVNRNRIIIEQNLHLKRLNEEKNALLSITAHDLKNPLTAIMGSAELLLKRAEISEIEENFNLVEIITSSSKKALNIIQDLLEVQALEEGKVKITRTHFDARDVVIQSVDEFMYAAAKKKIKINYEEDEKECSLFTDQKKFARIIDNLISNAIKFSPPNSEVNVKCECIDLSKNNPIIRVTIQDSGPGFTKSDLEKLYTKFAKLSAKPTGNESSTGLGLSIVKKIVELLDGIIELRTKENEGSTFIISFFKDNS